MKVHDVVQGTTAWFKVRSGIPTASKFDMILTPGGNISKSAERYMLTLMAERLMGHPIDDQYKSTWMARGNELESDAVAFYQLQRDLDTVPVGFITNDAGTIGASPDRLVGDEGLLEIKSPSEFVHMSYLLSRGAAYEEYKVQVQGQLWIAERQWTDVLSFHPELPPALIRIPRDEPYIAKLDKAVTAFSRELEKQYSEIEAQGWISAPREPLREHPFAPLPPLEELVASAKARGIQVPE